MAPGNLTGLGPAVIGWRAREEMIRRELARRKLRDFLKYRLHHESRDGSFLWNWHIDYICEVLEAVTKRQERRVIFNIPPRFMKTELTVETWPAWMIGRDPSPRSSMLSTSFSAKLAGKSARKTRDIIESSWFQALFADRMIVLDDSQQEKEDWETRHGEQRAPGAWRIAAGIDGTLTGRGASHLCWDDILKPKEANSDVMRTNSCEFLSETLSSRHNDLSDGTIVGIMQRLHELDPTGYLLDLMKTPGSDQYLHVTIPLEGDRPRVYSYGEFFYERKAGELLHAARMDATTVAAMKIQQVANFEGQYNQNPIKMQGNMFLWARANLYEGDAPDMTRVVQSWDFAVSEDDRENGCYSVCATAGITRLGALYILNIYRARINTAELVEQMIEQARRWRPYCVYGEEGVIKLSVMPFLSRRMTETGFRFRVEGVQPGRQDKAQRASAIEAAWNGGNVYLPKAAGWLPDLRLEITAFPKSRFLDQVDALAYIGMKYDELREGLIVAKHLEPVEVGGASRGRHEIRITGDQQRKKAGLPPAHDQKPSPPALPAPSPTVSKPSRSTSLKDLG